MTLPDERYYSIEKTRNFLLDLLDPKKTPRVPRIIRKQALWCLRHYPRTHEMESANEALKGNKDWDKLFSQIVPQKRSKK